ncbi:hypothetical protein HNV11_03525 [Spirosoma taeanense]|uniref:Outer membrane protein beta-barrel domain-containing protein n=1 Tax=Spirosoma taeanense TaxID=2735870 RepID=A0A6M5YDX9_9BACT|nr:hypothetical protein HNV11_03525 [Spirosoma taeanense]
MQSINLQLGTTGPGLFYTHLISRQRRLAFRIGGQYIAYQKPIRVKTAPDSYITIDPDFVIGTAQAGLKWQPFQRGAFFVAAGLGYTWHPNLNFVITAENKLNFDGLELTPEDVGTINLGFRWHPVVGYIGWGFGRIIPRRRFGVGFEMGMYYLGRPSVELTYEGFLETTNLDEQVPLVEQNLSNYRYLPAINLTLSYALSR